MSLRIIRDNATLSECYEDLSSRDLILGRLRLYPGEEHLLVDLLSRNVMMIPSATAQLCSRSKVFQSRLLGTYMVPGTRAVYSMNDMIQIVTQYGRENINKVVCKLDRANAGMGILQFPSIEDVYSLATLGSLAFPFVVQPFYAGCKDVRVIVLGEYMEAYRRHNPDNFRHNLHCGGMSLPWSLDDDQVSLCRKVMERAQFPYATIDLLVDPTGSTWVNEINLRGGLRGAVISQKEYLAAVDRIHTDLVERYTAS